MEAQSVAAFEIEQIEGEEMSVINSATAKPALKLLERGPALFVESDNLAVEDELLGCELLQSFGHSGKSSREVVPITGQE